MKLYSRKETPQFRRFFSLSKSTEHGYWTRQAGRRHSKQLQEVTLPHCPELLRRSALGLVKVYNLLPESAVATDCVKEFQHNLQELVKTRAKEQLDDWKETLSPRTPWWRHPLK